ncbi:MAG: hypothetical protein COA74_08575 [Gammaproteobacteria bacterium]|nr:MAG: hypothetical protein COA74_08575 [Gammaproteobacteria bacterium]
MKQLGILFFVVTFCITVSANSNYKTPPKMLADLVDAPRTPGVSISPDKKWMALMKRPGVASIKELAQFEEKLAGLRINPKIFAPSRSQGYNNIEIMSLTWSPLLPLQIYLMEKF